MLGVPSVLRRYDAGVPAAADGRRRPELAGDVALYRHDAYEHSPRGFCGDRTQQHPLSAIAAKNRAWEMLMTVQGDVFRIADRMRT